MNTETVKVGKLGYISRIICVAMLAYWGLYAFVTPVTNLDSQIYNLARLELAARGGLFNNSLFTSTHHLMWPWTFDAIHLPFLEIGWGCALPSYMCLLGTCYVVFAMVRARYTTDAAWVAVAGILGITCLVYQGTSTKNDIPILFSFAVWTYARWKWRRKKKNVYIFWMILTIGFLMGAKTTGILYATILACWSLWELRYDKSLVLRAMVGLIGTFILLGSVETYVESSRVFGYPLGHTETISRLRNQDGVRGGIANLSRYIMGGIYAGPVRNRELSGPPKALVDVERAFLGWTRLADAGMSPSFSDRSLVFFQSGLEELSGFGLVGTIAMATMLAACVYWRPRAIWWRLSSIAFIGVLSVSYTVAYNDWVNRFLISWYAMSCVATVCLLWDTDSRCFHLFRWIFAIIAWASAILAPTLSFNRTPSSIMASLIDRDQFETCLYPIIGKTRERLREMKKANPNRHIFFVVVDNSVILPLLEDPILDIVLVTPSRFLDLVATNKIVTGDFVIEDFPTRCPLLYPIEKVSAPDIFSKNGVRTQVIYCMK